MYWPFIGQFRRFMQEVIGHPPCASAQGIGYAALMR
jgi:hypothetical protein